MYYYVCILCIYIIYILSIIIYFLLLRTYLCLNNLLIKALKHIDSELDFTVLFFRAMNRFSNKITEKKSIIYISYTVYCIQYSNYKYITGF